MRSLLLGLLLLPGLASAATVTFANPTQDGTAGVTAFPANAQAITPSDADTFSNCVSVYVGVTGNVNVVPCGRSTTVLFTAVPAGSVLPVKVQAVYSTSTTATTMIGVY